MTLALVRGRGREWTIPWSGQVTIDDSEFARGCRASLETIEFDLLQLAGVVWYADRIHPRTPTRDGWARPLHVKMSVAEPARWNRPEVLEALAACLGYLSGDSWSFEFTGGGRAVQLVLAKERGRGAFDCVLPFSGGLDSYMLLHRLRQTGQSPLLMTARTTSAIRRTAHGVVSASSDEHAGVGSVEVGLPIRLNVGPHAEPSFRTRTFGFATGAAVAARISGAPRVLIAENGQGSLGASLVPFGAEYPYRTTHPVFTALYMRFFRALLGDCPSFEHPFLWQTKGSTLAAMVADGAGGTWERTVSCSRHINRHKKTSDNRSCGICGNCLLRRMSVHAAGLKDSTRYHWGFEGASLDEAVLAGGSKPTTRTDRAYAAANVVALDSFARLPDHAPTVKRAALSISRRTGHGDYREVLSKLARLRAQHALEWNSFLSDLPAGSWCFSFLEGADVEA